MTRMPRRIIGMADRRRQRPGTGKSGSGRAARPAGASGKPGQRHTAPGKPAGRQARSTEPGGGRVMRALNPRKPPSRSRVRIAALVFAGLTIVLGILGLTVDGTYLRSAALTAVLAVLWGVIALTMR